MLPSIVTWPGESGGSESCVVTAAAVTGIVSREETGEGKGSGEASARGWTDVGGALERRSAAPRAVGTIEPGMRAEGMGGALVGGDDAVAGAIAVGGGAAMVVGGGLLGCAWLGALVGCTDGARLLAALRFELGPAGPDADGLGCDVAAALVGAGPAADCTPLAKPVLTSGLEPAPSDVGGPWFEVGAAAT
jgi:hypothetical protein